MDVTISVNIGDASQKSLRSQRPARIIEGINPADTKFQQGYDITGNEEAYRDWSGTFKEYLVQDGDTLESIAKKFNSKPNTLAQLNKKKGNMFSDNVNVGQKLLIPVNENPEGLL